MCIKCQITRPKLLGFGLCVLWASILMFSMFGRWQDSQSVCFHPMIMCRCRCGVADAGGNKASLVQFSEISYKHRHRHQLSPAAGGRGGGGNLSHGPYTGGQWVAANTELGDTLQLLSMYGTLDIG